MLRKIVLFQGANTSTPPSMVFGRRTARRVGTSELAPIAGADASGLTPSNLTVFNGEVLFEGVNTSGQFGLWTTNGTPGNTTEVTGITDINDETVSDLTPNNLTVFNAECCSTARIRPGKAGLWVTNGTATGTQELVAGTAAGGLNPTGLALFKNEVLFNGRSCRDPPRVVDDERTTGGTTELTLSPGWRRGVSGLNPSDITAFGADVLLAATNERPSRIVGDRWNGRRPQELVAGAAQCGLNPADLTVLGAMALFSGVDGSGQSDCWRSTGRPAARRTDRHNRHKRPPVSNLFLGF